MTAKHSPQSLIKLNYLDYSQIYKQTKQLQKHTRSEYNNNDKTSRNQKEENGERRKVNCDAEDLEIRKSILIKLRDCFYQTLGHVNLSKISNHDTLIQVKTHYLFVKLY